MEWNPFDGFQIGSIDLQYIKLDGPPDSSEDDGSRVSNVIEELSWSQHNIENNN